MTPEHWQQIRDVLEKALELTPDERSAFLNQACSSDASLRQEVETLLASSPDVRSNFLQSSTLRVTLTSGTKLGDYEVKSLLGSGGMGEVYRARDSRLGRDVAIKVLPSLLSADSDRLRRFEQEARAAAALNHPNILAVFQMGTYEGAPYMVSELLEGEPLREPIRRGRLPVRKAIDYGVQITRGLAAAHEKGIVHRDLKPENLFVTKDGRVKILDFGLAKLTQPQSSSEHSAVTLTEGTEAGVVMGTVGYMSPEQVRGQTADHRADIFAFGAILYEMLAGKRAFQKPTSPETMTAILNEDPPGISQVVPNLPPALQRVVHRCLEKNAEQRFQSASDLAFALDALSESGGSAYSATAAKGVTGAGKRWKAVVAAALVALAAGGYIFFHRKMHTSVGSPAERPGGAPPGAMQFTPLTTTGDAKFAGISPDGRLVTYAREQHGKFTLWMLQLATGSTVQIAASASPLSTGPRFSPDGSYIYFSTQVLGAPKSTLYRVASLGGLPEIILDDVPSSISFSPDGKRFLFIRSTAAKHESYVMMAEADGGNPRIVATKKEPQAFTEYGPAWLPDGQHAAVVSEENVARLGSHLELVDIGTGKSTPFGDFVFAGMSRLTWRSNPDAIVFVGSEKSGELRSQIWETLYPSGQLRQITNDLNSYNSAGMTADGSKLVFRQDLRRSGLWLAPASNPDAAHQITPGTSRQDGIGISWNGNSQIVYGYLGAGTSRLARLDLPTSQPVDLHLPGEGQLLPASCGNGAIAYTQTVKQSFSIWHADVIGGMRAELDAGPSSFGPACSPDGKTVVYERAEGSETRLMRVPATGGTPQKLNDLNMANAAVSPDGRLIAALYWTDPTAVPKLALIPLEGGAPTRMIDLPSGAAKQTYENQEGLDWVPDSRSIVFAMHKDGVTNLWLQTLSPSGNKPAPPRQWTHFSSNDIRTFAISPDGKQVAFSRDTSTSDIVLITHLP
jgi:Tol biopolymer transport system component